MDSITYAGFVALIVLLLSLLKLRGRFYLLPTFPLAAICLSFFNFYGHYSVAEVTIKTEILLLISFVIFISMYSFACKRKYGKIVRKVNNCIDKKNTSMKSLLGKKAIWIYLITIIFYCCFDLWLNTYIYGSFEGALTRFYAKRPANEVPNILITFQGFMLKALVSFVFVFRYCNNRYHKKTSLLYVAVLLLVLIAFPKGSRGAAISPVVLIIMADLFSKRFIQNFSLLKKTGEYVVLLGIMIVLFFTLTFVRGIDFEDLSSAVETLHNFELSQGAEEFNEHEQDLMIKDLQFTFDNFGERYPFIGPFYTIASIIVNPIPRFLYSNKPVGFGVLLTEAKFGSGDFSVSHLETLNTGFAVGVAGEGWANGGFLGLIFYSILFGLYSGFFSKLFVVFIKSESYLGLILALLFFQASYNFIRGDLQSGVTQGIYPILIIMLVIKLFYRKRNEISN